MRIFRQTLAILVINILAGVLFLVAFFVFAFRGDPILTVLLLLWVTPVIIIQPWSVLFVLFVPSGALLAPFLTTAVSAPIFVYLDRTGELARWAPFLVRMKRRRVFGIVAVVLVGVVAIGMARYVDFPAMRGGAPRLLAYVAGELDLSFHDSRHYCLGTFIDSEWLWQATISEQDVNRLFETLDMHTIPIDEVGNAFWSMPPYWWDPVRSDQVRLMATKDFPMSNRGADGNHYLASWNPADRILHMWIKDNF